ncbi:hypothetical protein HY493_05645 [Candidatus Woesearchaeota archaeon]|nr:hypothetical protein [Candidatus Woesearchaeota archaeon]
MSIDDESYAFFGCDETYEMLQKWLPRVREMTRVPGDLELELMNGFDRLKSTIWAEPAEAAEKGQLPYAIRGASEGKPGSVVCGELESFMLNLYKAIEATPEDFRAVIVYRENGQFKFAEGSDATP